MAEKNADEKPETQPITGREKPSPETGEAGGRLRKEDILICSNDGAINYFDHTWRGYYCCWRCGTLNYN